MNKNLEKLFRGIKSIDEWIDLMEDLQKTHVFEKADKGEQISKGKNPLEKSNDEKQADAVLDQPPAAVPGETPGANISIGNKEIDKDTAEGEKPSEIKLGAKADKLEKKPKTKLQPNSEYSNIDAVG